MLTKDSFQKEIQHIVRQLVKLYKPKKIILFGSLARGNFKKGTDIDLFIIKEDVPEFGVDRIRQLDTLIKYKIATDFIVYKPQEVKKILRSGDPFLKSIIKEGRVLYEGG